MICALFSFHTMFSAVSMNYQCEPCSAADLRSMLGPASAPMSMLGESPECTNSGLCSHVSNLCPESWISCVPQIDVWLIRDDRVMQMCSRTRICFRSIQTQRSLRVPRLAASVAPSPMPHAKAQAQTRRRLVITNGITRSMRRGTTVRSRPS